MVSLIRKGQIHQKLSPRSGRKTGTAGSAASKKSSTSKARASASKNTTSLPASKKQSYEIISVLLFTVSSAAQLQQWFYSSGGVARLLELGVRDTRNIISYFHGTSQYSASQCVYI